MTSPSILALALLLELPLVLEFFEVSALLWTSRQYLASSLVTAVPGNGGEAIGGMAIIVFGLPLKAKLRSGRPRVAESEAAFLRRVWRGRP